MTADGRGANRLRRALDRVTGRAVDERIAALERAVAALAADHRDHASTQQARLETISEQLGAQPTAKDLRKILGAVRALGAQVDRSVEDQLARGGALERQQLDERRLVKRLEAVAAGTGPIVIGPWTGEVGFELLYWIPFVEWMRTRWSLDPAREAIVSRGGVNSWYGTPASRYVDAFSLISPEEFRSATNQEERKQRRRSALDERVVEAAKARLRLDDAEVLHPELMYRMFMPFWRDEAGFARLEQFTTFRRLTPPLDALPAGLPSDYVAVRFYFSQCFPDTPGNRDFLRSVVASLAERGPVVVLNPGLRVDDHMDFVPAVAERVHTIADGLAAERNLAVQSAVIAGARAFVGTYGGYSYLAPFYGVPALAFYSERTFKLHHLHVAQRVFERLGSATVLPIDTAHAPIVQLALAALAAAS